MTETEAPAARTQPRAVSPSSAASPRPGPAAGPGPSRPPGACSPGPRHSDPSRTRGCAGAAAEGSCAALLPAFTAARGRNGRSSLRPSGRSSLLRRFPAAAAARGGRKAVSGSAAADAKTLLQTHRIDDRAPRAIGQPGDAGPAPCALIGCCGCHSRRLYVQA